jgi:hypothetical protein
MKSLTAMVKILAFPAILLLALVACEEDNNRPTPPPDYPKSLGELLRNPAQRAKIKEMVFYLDTPSTLDSMTFIADHVCIYDNTIASNVNRTYANYQYDYFLLTINDINVDGLMYQSLNSSDKSTSVDTDSILIRQETGTQNYSILFRAAGIVDGVSYKSLRIFSGTLFTDQQQQSVFVNTYDCFVMLETGPDPEDKVADVGTIRVFKAP